MYSTNKDMKKVVISILILIMIISIANISFAIDLGDLNEYGETSTGSGMTMIVKKASIILTLVQYVGITSGVIILMIIGIKFITSSVEEKAEYKQRLIPWIIGAFLIMAGSSVPNAIYNMVNSTTKNTETSVQTVIYNLDIG